MIALGPPTCKEKNCVITIMMETRREDWNDI